MMIQGVMYKSEDGLAWLAEVPFLNLMTQADTQTEVPEMVKDAIELYVDDPNFTIEVFVQGRYFFVRSNDPKKLIALILKRQRQRKNLRLEDVSTKMKAKSINDYAQYEQGKHLPSFEKLERILGAIDSELIPYLGLKK